MKKYVMLCAAIAAAMMIFSCTKEQVEQLEEEVVTKDGLVRMTFNVGMEGDALSKAVLNSDGRTVRWDGTEKIAVIDDKNNDIHEFDANAAGATTSFSGYVNSGATDFKAIYPYSAITEYNPADGDSKPFYAVIPEVQEATLGSFDPAAAVYVSAYDNENKKFTFTPAFALLKIDVDVANVKEIVVLNTRGNISGSVRISEEGYLTSGSGSLSKKVTLKKGDGTNLSSGTYYLVVRFLGDTGTYENFQVYFITSDNKLGYRAASSAITKTELARKNVLYIGKLSEMAIEDSPYAAYRNGSIVYVGEHSFSEALSGEAVLVTSSIEDASLDKAIVAAGGVVFLYTPSGNMKLSGSPDVTKDLVLLSASSSNKAKLSTVETSINLKNASFFGSNLEISTDETKNTFTNKGSTKDIDNFVLTNSVINNIGKHFLTINSSTLDYGFKNIEMTYSRFQFKSAVFLFSIGSGVINDGIYKTVSFTNNYLFGSDTNIEAGLMTSSNETAATTIFTVSNNLFYNIIRAGSIKYYQAKDVIATKNAFWVKDGTQIGSKASNAKLFAFTEAPSGVSNTVTDNKAYGSLAGGKTWSISDSGVRGDMVNMKMFETDPIATADTANGTFTMASGYESYGPQVL